MIKNTRNKKNIIIQKKMFKLIIKILLIYLIILFLYKNNIVLCNDYYNIEDLQQEILNDLKEFSRTPKFKALTGFKNIKDSVFLDFLNKINIQDFVNQKFNRSEIKHIIKIKFLKHLEQINEKNNNIFHFLINVSIIYDIIKKIKQPTITDCARVFRWFKKRNFFTDIFNITLTIADILSKYYVYVPLVGLLIFLGFYNMIPESLFIVERDFSFFTWDTFLSFHKNVIGIDYTVTDGILQKDLLTNIKKFFIPKQISYMQQHSDRYNDD